MAFDLRKEACSMKFDSLFSARTLAIALCGIGIAGVAVFPAHADEWDKKTTLTVNQPIQVRDTLLPAGSYVFKLLNSSSDRHIVQIFNSDQSRIIDTILAIPNYRLQPTGNSRFTFWETPPGTARALRAWFYPGDNFGQEFPYPKQLAMLATAAPAPTVAPEPAPLPPPRAAEPEPPAPPAPQPQAMTAPQAPPAPVET